MTFTSSIGYTKVARRLAIDVDSNGIPIIILDYFDFENMKKIEQLFWILYHSMGQCADEYRQVWRQHVIKLNKCDPETSSFWE